MRIRHLSVRNFRGIRELDWPVPEQNLICLIGPGDSTKSTILEGLRRVFHPQWNLSFDDTDFHRCDPANPITIDAILGDLPDAFRDLEKYGHWLCGWDAGALARSDDPGDGLEDALRVRLTVAGDLEPEWSVIKNDADEGVPFKASDRAKVAVSLIGAVSDRHLTWSRGSILSQLTQNENIASSLADAARAAKAALEARRAEDLIEFDEVARTAEATAHTLGVNVAAPYRAHLDSDAINVRIAGLALHEGDMPLRRLGLGSKHMLTTGLQKQALRAPHITLSDEVEVGLEPHRIARLLQHLKKDDTGQYFLTTHLARRAAGTDRCRFAYRPLPTWVHQCDNCCETRGLPIPFKGKFAPAPKRSLRPRSSFAKAPPKSVFCAVWTIIGLNLRIKIHSPIAALHYSMPRARAISRSLPRPFKRSVMVLPSSPIPMSLTTSQRRMQKPCVTLESQL